MTIPATASFDGGTCPCCGRPPQPWTPTDTIDVYCCCLCGFPLQKQGVNMLPVEPWTLAVARAYWAEEGKRPFPGVHDSAIVEATGKTRSGASQLDIEEWEAWCELHQGRFQVPEE